MKNYIFTFFTYFIPFASVANVNEQIHIRELDVIEFGAKGDGKFDNTDAFQSALNEAGKVGATVYVPAGQFLFNDVLTIPRGVSLVGSKAGPNTIYYDQGTLLMPLNGRDSEIGPAFLTLNSGSTIRGFGIIYPEQKPDDIRPYPYCIKATGRSANIIDVSIANAYNGIDCGSTWNEGVNIKNVYLCALRRGLYIDRQSDIGRYENIHIHSVAWWDVYYPEKGRKDEYSKAWRTSVNKFTKENLEGFIIGRCDWAYMTNCFVIWAKVGFRFIATPDQPDRSGNILITQSGSDDGPLAVLVEKVQQHAGISFSNCQFMDGVQINESNSGPVKLTSCGFWWYSTELNGAHILNKGDGAVIITASHFNNNNETLLNPNVPAIDMQSGTLQIMNSRFQEIEGTKNPHIVLGENVNSAVIIGNTVEKGKFRILNHSDAKVQIIGNIME